MDTAPHNQKRLTREEVISALKEIQVTFLRELVTKAHLSAEDVLHAMSWAYNDVFHPGTDRPNLHLSVGSTADPGSSGPGEPLVILHLDLASVQFDPITAFALADTIRIAAEAAITSAALRDVATHVSPEDAPKITDHLLPSLMALYAIRMSDNGFGSEPAQDPATIAEPTQNDVPASPDMPLQKTSRTVS